MAKSAVITGGGSGIGFSLASALSNQGCSVVLVGRDQSRLQSAVSRISARGGKAIFMVADVTDREAVQAVVDRTLEEFGQLDYFFNNAGLGMAGEMEEFETAHWDRIIDINMRGVINGIAAAYPVMIKQGSGHIVNTASLAGLCPTPLMVPYATTKHAVVGLSLALRSEAAVRGVRVSVVCPGFVDTPMLDSKGPEDLRPSRLANAIDFREEASRVKPPYPPDKLAQAVLAGLAKNKAVIIAPRGLHALWVLYRLVPGIHDRLSPKTVARIRAQAASQPTPGAPVPAMDSAS